MAFSSSLVCKTLRQLCKESHYQEIGACCKLNRRLILVCLRVGAVGAYRQLILICLRVGAIEAYGQMKARAEDIFIGYDRAFVDSFGQKIFILASTGHRLVASIGRYLYWLRLGDVVSYGRMILPTDEWSAYGRMM
ncbi:uncharacterized protein LOC103952342 [Pyrus x bretschneideri]|uniref:uncharacterized protein LOC103952342 n=1 Tax=Pyrus x bretschneideri TaxID=225117 RepID=UPI0020305C5E|nr:uncharacterized protein LOC103952342 [Pyrus x bretschneideri]